MGKLGWLNFPPQSSTRLSAAAVPEQLQIAAADERHACLDEPDHRVAQRGCLPGVGFDARRTVNCDGDLAIGGAVHAPIGCAEPQAKTAALIDGHARVAEWRTFKPGPGQPGERIDAVEDVVIDWDDCRELILWRCAGKEKDLEVVLGKGGISPFGAVTLRAEPIAESIAGGGQEVWPLRQDDEGWIVRWRPHHLLLRR